MKNRENLPSCNLDEAWLHAMLEKVNGAFHWSEPNRNKSVCDLLIILVSIYVDTGDQKIFVEQCIEEILDAVDVDAPDSKGVMILEALVRYDTPLDTYQRFLDKASNPNPIRPNGESTLYKAVSMKRYDIAKILFQAGVAPDMTEGFLLEAIKTEKRGNTNADNIIWFIHAVINYYDIHPHVNKSALLVDLYRSIRYLIKKCYAKERDLRYLYADDMKPVLSFLLDKYRSFNGDINKLDEKSHSLLFYAILRNEMSLVNNLVIYGAHLTEDEQKGMAPILMSAMFKSGVHPDVDSLLHLLNEKPLSINESRMVISYLERTVEKPDQCNTIFSTLMSSLNKIGMGNIFRHKRMSLEGIFWGVKGAQTTWGEILNWMVKSRFINDLSYQPEFANTVNEKLISLTAPTKMNVGNLDMFQHEGWKPFRIIGRTIVFEHPEHSSCKAIKLQKKNEDLLVLFEQYLMVKKMQDLKIEGNIESDVPDAEQVAVMKGVGAAIRNLSQFSEADKNALIDLIWLADDDSCRAYIYETKNKDYFSYLHDVNYSDQAFVSAAKKSFADLLYYLFHHNIIFHQLADMFHTSPGHRDRHDGGRYRAFMAPFWEGDCGRMDAWELGVAFPNIRYSGLADEGDCLRNINKDNYHSTEFSKKCWEEIKDYTPAFQLSFVAEYMLVIEMLAGFRAKKQCKEMSASQQDDVWRAVGHQLREIFVYGIAKVSGLSEDFVSDRFDLAFDWNQYGRQMGYWMSGAYAQDVKGKSIKNGLYHPSTKIVFPDYFSGTIDDTLGFSNSGTHADIGAFSGMNPIKEGEGIRYFAVAFLNIAKHFSVVVVDPMEVDDPNQTPNDENEIPANIPIEKNKKRKASDSNAPTFFSAPKSKSQKTNETTTPAPSIHKSERHQKPNKF